MRELSLNGYIDDEVWFGDEITPDGLHSLLYGEDNTAKDDVHIRLNSYGGSCNAATRMFDDIRAYPGKVKITVSGTAASAATVVCMAADRLEMTPGSLLMIHDPSTVAYGNERDMDEAKAVLRACKESILNMYGTRIRVSRDEAADMMSATSWMDANEAFEKGFVDGITEINAKLPTDSMERKVSAEGGTSAPTKLEDTPKESAELYPATASAVDGRLLEAAKAGVQAWFDRKTKPFLMERKPQSVPETAAVATVSDTVPEPASSVPDNRVQVLVTDTRLEHLRF